MTTNNNIFEETLESIKPGLARLQTFAIVLLIAGVVLSAAGYLVQGPAKFFQSYLTSYIYWFGITVGCIGFLMLHHTVGGGWGFIIRRLLEAGSRCLWLVFLLFIPILLGMQHLFEWVRPEAEFDAIVQAKEAYLNVPFFIARYVLYFAIWGVFVYLFNKWGAIFDERSDAKVFGNLTRLGAIGLLIHVLLVTFMSVDWVMSLTPHWFSSVFGPLFVVGQALTTLALMNVLIGTLGAEAPIMKLVPQKYFRDLGNFMMALVLVWSYLSFSQYVILYSGNTAEGAIWYVIRRHGGWGIIGTALVLLHFILPFALLLSSSIKVDPKKLWKVAAFILVTRWLDILFLTRPSFERSLVAGLHIADLGTMALLGGAWLFLWSREVQKRPLVPAHDPRFAYNWAVHEHHREHGEHEDEISFAVAQPKSYDEAMADAAKSTSAGNTSVVPDDVAAEGAR